MKVVIVGAGFVGTQLARTLVAEGNGVVLIDKDVGRVRDAGNQIDCAVVLSDGNSPAALDEADIGHSDALVAVTAYDEVNMITCSYVEAHYPHVLRVARVRNYAYYESARPVGGDASRPVYGIDRIVHPNIAAAKGIRRAITSSGPRNGLCSSPRRGRREPHVCSASEGHGHERFI